MTKRFCPAFLALALASCASPAERFRLEPPEHNSWTVLPLLLDEYVPLVEIQVNGKTVKVLFDLGSRATLWLEPHMAEARGAKFSGESRTYSEPGTESITGRRYVLDECRLGDLVFRDIEGTEYPWVGRSLAVNGHLGWALLMPFRVLIDYPGRRLVLASGQLLPPDVDATNWTPVPFRMTCNGIATDVNCDGRTFSLLWHNLEYGMYLGEGRVRFQEYEGRPFRDYDSKSFRIGGRDFGRQNFRMADDLASTEDGIIGEEFFEHHRILIDWQAGELWIE